MTSNVAQVNILPGLTPYELAHSLQLKTVEQRKANEIPDTLMLLEHPPVITLGQNADTAGVLASQSELDNRSIQVHRIERGGQATYHGPGQIVGYPIVNLHHLKMGVSQYVSNLEEIMIYAAQRLGVSTERKAKTTGVFSTAHPKGKIGAIGVRVTRGITYHGFAFNVNPNLAHYGLIVPCGMATTPVSSIYAMLHQSSSKPTLQDAQKAIIEGFETVFNTTLIRSY